MKEELKKLLDLAYAPYSKYRVAAILKCDDKLYTGVNVENASFGATICAERVAITKAVSDGHHHFKELYVMVDDDKIGTCCFLCRQVIAEFFDRDGIITCFNNLGESQTFTVSALCPFPFSKENLE